LAPSKDCHPAARPRDALKIIALRAAELRRLAVDARLQDVFLCRGRS
jgi:hypothetical protein